MQGAKVCKVQNYARCKNMQGAKICKVQKYAVTWHLRETEEPSSTLDRSVSPATSRTIGAWCTWEEGIVNLMRTVTNSPGVFLLRIKRGKGARKPHRLPRNRGPTCNIIIKSWKMWISISLLALHLLKTISSEDVERFPPMETIGSAAACNGFETPDSEVIIHCNVGGGWPPQAWHRGVSFSPPVIGEGRDAMVTDTTGKLSSTTISV